MKNPPLYRYVLSVLLSASLALCSILDSFPSPLTPDPVISNVHGTVCAYGDFNMDRLTDMLHYLDGRLTVFFQMDKDFSIKDKLEHSLYATVGVWDEIACSVGDINGDGHHDILVSTRKTAGTGPWTVRYFFFKAGEGEGFQEGEQNWTTADEPALIDVTGDGVHDVMGILEEGTLLCVPGAFAETADPGMHESCADIFPGWSGKVNSLMPMLYGDITNDRFAEVIFMKVDGGETRPEVWKRNGSIWSKLATQPKPDSGTSFKYILAPLLVDIDLNAKMDLIVPVCKDSSCTQIESLQAIHYESVSETDDGQWSDWTEIAIELNGSRIFEDPATLARLQVGDATLDGYPDLLATVYDPKSRNSRALIIESYAVKEDTPNIRRFAPPEQLLVMPAIGSGQVKSSHFFDFAEDGVLDVLVQYAEEEGGGYKRGWTLIIKKDKQMDVTFLKLQIFLPLPPDRDIKKGLGVEWGGACASYEMETAGVGSKRVAIDCQRTTNSHKAGISPPFSLFGLGRASNFIDLVEIGIPRYTTTLHARIHEQKQIVPNARMMVQPPTAPNGTTWILRLYLTPSALIYASILVMVSTCSLLLLFVLILHFREKKVDRVERAAQSHRFHFDAM